MEIYTEFNSNEDYYVLCKQFDLVPVRAQPHYKRHTQTISIAQKVFKY